MSFILMIISLLLMMYSVPICYTNPPLGFILLIVAALLAIGGLVYELNNWR